MKTINELMMIMTLAGQIKHHFVSAHPPTAAATCNEKEESYDKVKQTINRKTRKGITIERNVNT